MGDLRSFSVVAWGLACCVACAPSSSPGSRPQTPPAGPPGAPATSQSGGPGGPADATPSVKSDLFYRTFGDIKHQAVVFVHGGPGANSFGFERSVAQPLADRGFYVVAYDQRGSGRSPMGAPSDYSYKKSSQDLAELMKTVGIDAPILLPHSFGGSVALHFLELHPGVAKGVVLLGSPLDFPDTYFTILERAAAVYRNTWRLSEASDVDALRHKMFPLGLVGPFSYSAADISSVAQLMFKVGLTSASQPTPEAVALALKLALDPDGRLLVALNPEVGNGYQANDQVGYQDLLPLLGRFREQAYALYGDEDQMFSPGQIAAISAAIPPGHFASIHGASHFMFTDQARDFVDVVARDLAALK